MDYKDKVEYDLSETQTETLILKIKVLDMFYRKRRDKQMLDIGLKLKGNGRLMVTIVL